MPTEKIPEKMRPIYDEIVTIIDAVCSNHLTQEYADLGRKAAATLSRKRPSPLASGKAKTWAAGIIYALGQANFIFDKSQPNYLSSQDLCALFEVSQGSASAKAKQIRDMLKIDRFNHTWLLPSRMDDFSIIWMVMVNGYIVDIRDMPRPMQEHAYLQGVIPYIPADRE